MTKMFLATKINIMLATMLNANNQIHKIKTQLKPQPDFKFTLIHDLHTGTYRWPILTCQGSSTGRKKIVAQSSQPADRFHNSLEGLLVGMR